MSSSRALVLLGLALVWVVPRSTAVKADDYLAKAYDKSSPFGIVGGLGNRVRDDEQDAAVSLMREAGVQWDREEIYWDRLQPQKGGPYLWGGNGSGFYNYDASIDRLRKAKINVLAQLDYNPAWFKSKNPTLDEWIKDWGDFVYNTVAHYGRERGQVKYWEIWNEPNIRKYGYENGLYTIQDFVRMLDVAKAAAKAADPDAIIVLGGVASIWGPLLTPQDYDVNTYLRMIHDAGGWNSFDILAIHPYRPGAPEAGSLRRDTTQDFEAELRVVDGLLAEFGNKPVWLTEVSWSTYNGFYGVSETDQAAFLVRMYLLAMSHPSVQRVFWYDLRNDTSPLALYDKPVYDPAEPEFNFGLLRRSFPLDPNRADLRKPAFVAYRTMTEVLAGMAADGVLASGDNPAMPGTFGYRYTGDGRTAVVLWRINADTAPVLTIACGCKDARVRQWDGKVLSALQTTGTITIRLDYVGVPLYIEWGQDRVQDGRLFAETGHRVPGAFLQYWTDHGGLQQFGYPITAAVNEPEAGTGKPKLVQYFERNRFEYFPGASNPASSVQIGRLGDELLRKMGIDWTALPRETDTPPPDCLAFPATGHRICPPFRDFWEHNGGLALYGMPLTEAYDQNGTQVQYFERNRFEYHPDKAGTPFEIQLGLLGRALYSRWSAWP